MTVAAARTSRVRGLRAVLLAAAAVLALPLTSRAQALKIGIFDKQRIVDESKLGTASKAKFEKLQADREAEVNDKQKSFDTLQQSFNQQQQVLSDDKKLKMQQKLARARDEWQSAAGNADRDLQRAYQAALMEIVNRIDPIIEDYGKVNGYDVLFDKSQCAFSKDALDITGDLIKKIDAAAAPGPAAPPAR